MTTSFAFALGLITSCLQMVGVGLSWVLSAYFGRRTIYLWGTAANLTFLFALGIVSATSHSNSANFAQACLGVIISFVFALTLGPISYTIISETSAVRLRALSTGLGRAAYYVAEIPMIYRASRPPLSRKIC
jgi:SP family general alpha glucoside:H+ symporter-like MFS transporter